MHLTLIVLNIEQLKVVINLRRFTPLFLKLENHYFTQKNKGKTKLMDQAGEKNSCIFEIVTLKKIKYSF